MEPPFNLSPVPVVEDADDSCLYIHALASCAHRGQRAHVLVVAENVVLAEPEPSGPQPIEPRKKRVASVDVSCHDVSARDVPDHSGVDKRSQQGFVARSERISRTAIRDCIRMLVAPHASKATSQQRR